MKLTIIIFIFEKNNYMSKEEIQKEFYTVPEVAKLLDVTENTVREQIRKGNLKGYKKLKKWFVFKEDLKKYIQSK